MKTAINFLLYFCFSVNLLSYSVSIFADESTFGDTIQTGFIGPYKKGPLLDQSHEHQPVFDEIVFHQEEYEQNQGQAYLNFAVFEVEKFLNRLNKTLTCPIGPMDKYAQYFLYLYRLISVSLLYEAFNEYSELARKFGIDSQFCHIKMDELAKKCSPQTDDMKTFVQRLNKINDNKFYKLDEFSTAEFKSWQNKYVKDASTKKFPIGVNIDRIRSYCKKHQLNCRKETKAFYKKIMINICYEDKELIFNICSERDDLKGLSYIKLLPDIINKSVVKYQYYEGGKGAICLKEFPKYFRLRERKRIYLKSLFAEVYENIKDGRYQFGRPFVAGIGKVFDSKGLKDFLSSSTFEKINKTKLKVPVAIQIKKNHMKEEKPKKEKKQRETKFTLEDKLKLEPIFLSNKKEKGKEKKIEKKQSLKTVHKDKIPEKALAVTTDKVDKADKIEKTKENSKLEPPQDLSSFDKCAWLLDNGTEESVPLDMDQFAKENPFPPEKIELLKVALKDFFSQQGLENMKNFDSFGQEVNPIPLKFLKFLIEIEEHQGLFNIVAVLGNEFWVINNKAQTKKPRKMHLEFDESENPAKWKMTLSK